MAEIAAVTAKLDSDTRDFDAGFDRAEQKTSGLERQMAQLEATIKAMGASSLAEMSKLAESVQEVIDNTASAAEQSGSLADALVPEIGLRQIKRFGAALNEVIADTSKMDPQLGKAWADHLGAATNAAKTFAGHVGELILPALIKVVDVVTDIVGWLNKFDFKKFGSDIAYVAHEAWDALKSLGEFIVDWDIKIARALMSPFQAMKDALLQSITDSMEAIAKVQDFAKNRLGVGGGGAGIRESAESMKAMFEGDVTDGILNGLKTALSATGGLLAEGASAAFGATSDRYMTGGGESFDFSKKDGDGGAGAAAKQKAIEAELAKAVESVNKELAVGAAAQAENEQRIAALRVAGLREAEVLARKSDADGLKNAEDQAKVAQRLVRDARQGGSIDDVAEAQKALDAAFGHVQQAAATAVDHDRARLDGLEKQLTVMRALDDGSAAAKKSIQDTEKQLQTEQERLNQDGHKLEGIRAANIERAKQEAAAAAEHMKSQFKQLGQASLGSGANVVQAGVAGAAEGGGPAGAIAGVVIALLEQSKEFPKLIAAVSGIFQRAADAIGPILAPLIPALEQVGVAIQPLFGTITKILVPIGVMVAQAIGPIADVINMIANLVATLLAPVSQVLIAIGPLIKPMVQMAVVLTEMALVMNPAVDAIILAVVTLSALAKVLAPVLRAVVEGIAIVWNAVLTELSKVLDFLAHALPGGMGDAARALQQQVEGMKINTGGFDSAVQQTTNSLNQMSASAKAYSDSAQASFQKWIADSEKARADWAAYQDLLSKGDKGGAAAALASYKQDEKNKTADLLQQQIDEAKSYQAQGHGNDEYIYGGKDTGRTYTQEIEELLKEQAEANAKNTAATQGNTAATNALNHAMTNVPANFKTAQVVNQVLSGQFSGSGGGTRFGGDPTAGRSAPGLRDRINSVLQGGTYNEVVIQGDVHVHADGADIFEAIKRKISEDKRVRTGSSARDLTNRFANLGQG